MKINMGLGTSDAGSRFAPTKGKSREHGKDHVPTKDNEYNAGEAVEYAMDNGKEVRE
ncbi:MAG: hypothetical protein IKK43_05070 [Clostridia bacterium]|nr:hypothetical protein [Clostridia bacterium]